MRQLEFVILGMHGELETSGTLLDLLGAIPYLLMNYVPPRAVINSILAAGENDAGMSGGARWSGFEIDAAEYADVAGALEQRGLKKLDCPDWVQTFNDWSIWIYEVDHEVPADEHRRLDAICRDIEGKAAAAFEADDHDKAGELSLEVVRANQQLSEFVDKYFVPKLRDAE